MVQLLNPLKYILICFGQIFSLTVVHAIYYNGTIILKMKMSS